MSDQVADYWAKQEKSDFAAVVQPFLSDASSDNFTIDFLSMVRAIKISWLLVMIVVISVDHTKRALTLVMGCKLVQCRCCTCMCIKPFNCI